MNCFASVGLPDEAYVSVRSKLIEDDGEINRPTRNRRKTDTNFIFVMAFFFALLACMLIYCGVTGREADDGLQQSVFNLRQFAETETSGGMHDKLVKLNIQEMFYMVGIIVLLIMITILLLRYFIGAFIWALLVLGSLTAILITIFFWIHFFQVKDSSHGFIVIPLVCTVVTFVIVFLIYATRRRIQMIIQIFKEASKAIGDMPQLFLQPAISFAAFLLSAGILSYLSMVVYKAGNKANGAYNPDDIVICTFVFLYWGGIWLMYFYKGCQSMVIGGTIATWYFRRDKTSLGFPMWRTTSNLVRYHLGTVAFGSFLMLLMEIVKTLVDFFTKRKAVRICCCCCACFCCLLKNCIKYLEDIIKYFTQMSYIMTSIHSVPFCTGCREAMTLLLNHAFSLLQLKCFCKFVLGLLQLIIVGIAVGLSRVIYTDPITVDTMSIISGVFAFYAANSFLSVYNTSIDTIFLCYCEDLAENDGVSKPYFMSRDLMRFMEDSKRTLGEIVRQGV